MTYFSTLSPDLKSELLQYFWIDEIAKLSTQLIDFEQLGHNECFWREVYKTHIDKDFSYKDLCLKKWYAISRTYLRNEEKDKHEHYTMLDSCIYHNASNSVAYCADKTNNLMSDIDQYLSCVKPEVIGKLVTEEDISTLLYLYNKGYLSSNDILETALNNLTVFKYFVPSIITINKSHYLDLFANIYLTHPYTISNAKRYRKFKEVEKYILSEVF